MTTGPRLSIIPAWVISDPRLKGMKDLSVLCMLGQNANTRHGWCRRSQVQLSKALNCSRSTVQASINRLVEIGAVERREVVSANGRDSAHWYRVIYDSMVESSAFDAWDEQDQKEFDPTFEFDGSDTPAATPAPPADPRPAPPAVSGPAPINASTLTPPDQRDQREARERGSSNGHGSPNADMVKRVQRFCTGTGYREGEWPKWATSTIGHITQQFAKLTPEQQDAACAARDVFLAKCRRERISKPMPVANFFRDLVWDMLTDTDRAAYSAENGGSSASVSSASHSRIAAPVFGPVWGVARMLPLLRGAVDVTVSDRQTVTDSYAALAKGAPGRALTYAQRKGISIGADGNLLFPEDFEQREYERAVLADGYPETNRLHDAARNRERAAVDIVLSRCADLMEPVKVGSDLWNAWLRYHELRNWPFVPDPGSFPVVYFPKGGPDGLTDFETAAMAAMSERQGHDDAA